MTEIKPLAALKLWQSVLVAGLAEAMPDLSARQLAILLTVYLEPAPHTVRGMAEKLHISKPAVTRALDTLGRLDLLRRRQDEKDRRSILIQRTVKGSVYLSELGEKILEHLKKAAS